MTAVAVDGSEASIRALVWALRHAAGEGLRVEVFTAWPVNAVMVHEVPGHFNEARWRARELQAAAVAKALAAVDEAPPYDLRVENAAAIDALIRASEAAALLVVGSDGPVPTGDVPGGARRTRLTESIRVLATGRVVIVGPEGTADTGTDPPSHHVDALHRHPR